MKDCILYISHFPTLLTHLRNQYPDMVYEDNGVPVVVGVARTSARILGNEMMVYARLLEGEEDKWADMPGVEAWGLTEFEEGVTAKKVYDAVFADEEKKAIYDRIYPHEPYTVEDGGESFVMTPPVWFGIISGA